MTITKIERQKNDRGRFSIFVDDAYAFSVSEDIYARFVLYSGQSLTDEERTAIEKAEAEASVKRIALRYRSFRPRSRRDVADYLKKKGFAPPSIDIGLAFLDSQNLLNDAEYARMFVRDRMRLKPVGRSTMKQLLYRKGIDRDLTDHVIAEIFPPEAEPAAALKEAEKKWKRIAKLPELVRKKRLYEHLVRRGYEPGLAITITNRLNEQ